MVRYAKASRQSLCWSKKEIFPRFVVAEYTERIETVLDLTEDYGFTSALVYGAHLIFFRSCFQLILWHDLILFDFLRAICVFVATVGSIHDPFV
jgi:hypothetical protein